MAHISTIGAGIYTDLAFHNFTTPLATVDDQAEFEALFATENDTAAAGTFSRIKDIRDFPSFGTPANIVNVPVYGQPTSQQIQGQADAPSLALTLNYIAADWAASTIRGLAVGDGKLKAFRIALLGAKPANYASATPTGIGAVGNSVWYFKGKIESIAINPQLKDAITATLTLSIQSAFYGAYTLGA